MATSPTPIPAQNIFQMLWQDFVNLLNTIFGRITVVPTTPVPSSAQANTNYVSQTPIDSLPSPYRVGPVLTPKQAFDRAFQWAYNFNPRDASSWQTPANQQLFQNEILAGQLDFITEQATCGGSTDPGLNLQQASSLALTGASVGTSIATQAGVIAGSVAGAIGGVVLPGVGAIVGIVTAIFQHHAQAVARDNAAQCHLIPAANNCLKVIIQGVQAGQLSPAQGVAAIDAIPGQFKAGAGAALNYSPYCNALCEEQLRLRAICYYWDAQFGNNGVGMT